MLCILTIFLKHLLNEWCVCLNHYFKIYLVWKTLIFESQVGEKLRPLIGYWRSIGRSLGTDRARSRVRSEVRRGALWSRSQSPGDWEFSAQCIDVKLRLKNERGSGGSGLGSFPAFSDSTIRKQSNVLRVSNIGFGPEKESIDSYWLKSALWAIDMLGKSSLESYSLLIIEGRFLFFSDAIVTYYLLFWIMHLTR